MQDDEFLSGNFDEIISQVGKEETKIEKTQTRKQSEICLLMRRHVMTSWLHDARRKHMDLLQLIMR